jgi:alcohol dehydrogenase class IV
MTIPNRNFNYPTAIKYGPGRIKELADHCKANGIKRPLFVTDKGLASMPMVAEIMNDLKAAGLKAALFSDVRPNPIEENVLAGCRAFSEGKHDGVIAFGGGSGLDTAKMIALMHSQNVSIFELEDIGDWWTRADASVISPIIAVPTTAGTGSEVGRAGVVTHPITHEKKIIFHPAIMPKVSILDPELTVGLPAKLTAATGMDALAHNLEAYCAPFYHPLSAGIALEGMRLVKEYLPRAYKDGTDIEARANMMSAAAMGAVAFQKGLGAIHSLSHPVGAIYNTHHGMTNAVVMPPVLRFNRPAIEDRIVRAAAYLGISGGFDGFYDYVLKLREELGVPDKLAALGVGTDRIDEMSEMAIVDPTAGGNPVELTLDAAKKLFRECI